MEGSWDIGSYPDGNPKTAAGAAKPKTSAIPPLAIMRLGQAMEDGRRKYGLTNWRGEKVSSSVYFDAAMRHLLAWWDGEDRALDSGVDHLAHVMACCAILIDADSMAGWLNDDRPAVKGAFAREVRKAEQGIRDLSEKPPAEARE